MNGGESRRRRRDASTNTGISGNPRDSIAYLTSVADLANYDARNEGAKTRPSDMVVKRQNQSWSAAEMRHFVESGAFKLPFNSTLNNNRFVAINGTPNGLHTDAMAARSTVTRPLK
ncbi:hypothetical protein TcasGA2_TC013388 [Tribolium castaneum]|uniref:Uncharacterized protein n=1 Tax=Tribolium castaneum TaxID=7070 RepID=D6WLU1_TRICA|nr:hypothetical protein TcasGA2_TC013388 [Tribolium castaneum]